jgi:hypothetical protein
MLGSIYRLGSPRQQFVDVELRALVVVRASYYNLRFPKARAIIYRADPDPSASGRAPTLRSNSKTTRD